MSLSAAKPILEAAILAAFEARKADGENNAQLAADLASAIHTYATSADVDISPATSIVTTTPPGQAFAGLILGTASPAMIVGGTCTGATAAPSFPVHAGFGKLK